MKWKKQEQPTLRCVKTQLSQSVESRDKGSDPALQTLTETNGLLLPGR